MRGLAAVESLLLAWLMAFAPAVAAGSAATIASPEIGSAARGPNIELRTVEPEARIELPAAGRLAFAGVGRVWLGTANGVAFVDPLTNEATEVVNVGHDVGLAVGFGSLWLTDFDRNLVERRDPVSGAVVAEIEVGTNPGHAVVTDDAVWIANHRAGTVSRIDPATNREIATIT